MELNIPLPQVFGERLKQLTSEQPVYCVRSQIDTKGDYTDSFYIGATKSLLFVFSEDGERIINISDCQDARAFNMVDNGVFTVTIKGEEYILARYTQKTVTQFTCLARGIKNFIDGRYDRIVTNKDREKECPRCGRILPGTGLCPKCERRGRNASRLLSLCKGHWAVLSVIFAIMVTVTALNLGQQFVMRWFINDHLAEGKGGLYDITLFLMAYVGITLVSMSVSLLRSFLCRRLGMDITYDLRERLCNHIQRLSMSFLQKRHAGEIMERVFNDTYSVRMFFTNSFCEMFSQVITLVALVIIMLVLNWKLALACFAFAPLIVIFSKTFWPHIRKIFHRQRRKGDRIQNKLQDVLSGIRIVKSYGKEACETEEFCRLNDELAAVQKKNERFFATVFPVLTLLISFGSCLMVYLGGIDVLAGKIKPGDLAMFVSFSGMLLGPLNWMTFLPRHIVNMTTGLDRIYDIFDEQPDITAAENPVKKQIDGNIEFENVTFGYRSYEMVLEGVNLNVKKGEMIGLVGASGTGKSTMINLIMRLYDPDEGKILVDGIDLRRYDPADYHRQIGVVLQETFLFAGTVAENIRFAHPDAQIEDVIKAAKFANAHEFICRLPDGYNTYIGERGHMLSGGEKQRIAIARAILTDPKILILDEATSALDTESEYQIQQALERLRKGRTTFAIAHRLSTLRCADRLAVLNDRKIVELGTHNELLKQKGIYYDLVMAQLKLNGEKQK